MIKLTHHPDSQIKKFTELDLIGSREVGRMLKLSSKDILRYVRKGTIPAPLGEISGRSVWSRSVITAHLKLVEYQDIVNEWEN